MAAKFCCECGKELPKRRVKNPHNAKDEFCSQDCAKLAREKYLETGRKNFLLYAEGDPQLLGVFGSIEAMLRGASYQEAMYKLQNKTLGKLFYETWVTDFPQGPKEWSWLPVVEVTSFRNKK